MFNRFTPTSLAFLMAGAFLGWAVASGKVSTSLISTAAPVDTSINTNASCCSENLTKEKMLALAVAPQSAVDADKPKATKESKRPNILVIWGDDIGTWNISHNNRGMMGYTTPNIDRIAREGISFTDYYGQQSCTAGRAAFLGGNVPA